MAVRYCGSLTVELIYHDDVGPNGAYRCVVAGERLTILPPVCGFGIGISYDSPLAYDAIAKTAVNFSSTTDGLDRDDSGPVIRRTKAVK